MRLVPGIGDAAASALSCYLLYEAHRLGVPPHIFARMLLNVAIEGTVGAVEAPLGEGKVFLLGVEATFRGQPHGTYKLLFNSLYAGPAKAATLAP